jgi:hypothetical protein
LGILPFNTPLDRFTKKAITTFTDVLERRMDRVETVGTPLNAKARTSAAAAGTLILSSGYACTEKSVAPFARSAQRDGFTVERFGIPDHGMASIADAARGLHELVRTKAPAGPLHFGMHSKGGPVLMEWWRTASPELRDRVESVTLLASPIKGMQLPHTLRIAAHGAGMVSGPFNSIMTELRHTSPTMRGLQGAAAEAADRTRSMSIISERDELIRTDDAHWEGAHNIVLDGRDAPFHLNTLVRDDVYEAMRENVLGAPLAPIP